MKPDPHPLSTQKPPSPQASAEESVDASGAVGTSEALDASGAVDSPMEGGRLDERRERGALGWLYYRSGITVSALNKVILIGMIAMVVLFIYFATTSKGFLIVFDSRGGTDVPSQRVLYGETIDLPDPPTREGYEFVGWSPERESDVLYDPSTPVDIGFELFAQWDPLE